MNIVKSGGGPVGAGQPTEQEMKLIEGFTKSKVEADSLYTFEIMLCDNDVDRDMERFDDGALAELAKMFVGKSGIFDHNWSAHQQVARIYFAEARRCDSVITADGRQYMGLFAKAYMLKNADNEGLIQSIEAGIRKEVSISCGMGRRVCSVCGADYGQCVHQKGTDYESGRCHVVLKEPTDAYEWSFVAVPAQRQAGVMKKYDGEDEKMELRKFLTDSGGKAYLSELDRLEKEAEAGRKHLDLLRDEVVRLGSLCGCGVPTDTLKAIAGRLEADELESLKKTYGEKAGELYPTPSQLTMAKTVSHDSQDEYLI